MYPIGTLVKGIFSFNIVKHFPYTYTISSGYNSGFIKLIFIFS